VPQVGDLPRSVHGSLILIFVSPDSLEVAALARRLGDDDFFVAADDAMWYRAAARELADSLGIPAVESHRGTALFRVDGAPVSFDWRGIDRTWFVIIYDGVSAPRIAADVDFADQLRAVGLPAP